MSEYNDNAILKKSIINVKYQIDMGLFRTKLNDFCLDKFRTKKFPNMVS